MPSFPTRGYPIVEHKGTDSWVAIVSVPDGAGYGDKRAGGVVHWGVDLAGSPGDPVIAPETMEIVDVAKGAGTAVKLPPPLDGYGPGAVLGYGASGVFHLLAHLDPSWWADNEDAAPTVGRIYLAGEQVGAMPAKVGAAGAHVHWEVRLHEPYDSPATREDNTIDPLKWARSVDPHGNPPYQAGEWTLAAVIAAKRAAGPSTPTTPAWVKWGAAALVAWGLLKRGKRRSRR